MTYSHPSYNLVMLESDDISEHIFFLQMQLVPKKYLIGDSTITVTIKFVSKDDVVWY